MAEIRPLAMLIFRPTTQTVRLLLLYKCAINKRLILKNVCLRQKLASYLVCFFSGNENGSKRSQSIKLSSCLEQRMWAGTNSCVIFSLHHFWYQHKVWGDLGKFWHVILKAIFFFTCFFFVVFILNQYWCDIGSGSDVFIQYSASLTSAMLFLETLVVGVHLLGEKTLRCCMASLMLIEQRPFNQWQKPFKYLCATN